MQRLLSVVVGSLLVVVAGANVGHASLVRALRLDELVAQSEHIVVVTVLRQRSLWDERHRIVTDSTVRVETRLKGGLSVGHQATVRRLGGVIGDLGMRVEGEPVLEENARYLVFARRVDGVLRAVGMSQGVMRISDVDGRPIVQPNLGGALLVQPTGGQVVPTAGPVAGPTSLVEVTGRVTSLLSRDPR